MKKQKLISKTAIYLYLVLALVGCSEHEKRERRQEVNQWQTVEYNNCEYIIGFRKMAHKGNCKYCKQRMVTN